MAPCHRLGITLLYQDVYSEHPAKKIEIKTEIQNNFARFYAPSLLFSLVFLFFFNSSRAEVYYQTMNIQKITQSAKYDVSCGQDTKPFISLGENPAGISGWSSQPVPGLCHGRTNLNRNLEMRNPNIIPHYR